MKNTIISDHKLFFLCILSALLFQGCAAYSPQQPVYSPPPPPAAKKQLKPAAVPSSPPSSQETNVVAANFSRQAADQARQGRPDLAAATLERGLRAAPKEAMLWTQLAEIKLQQHHYLQARSLAAKSNSLAGSNTKIIQKNHWIIEEALKRAANQ